MFTRKTTCHCLFLCLLTLTVSPSLAQDHPDLEMHPSNADDRLAPATHYVLTTFDNPNSNGLSFAFGIDNAGDIVGWYSGRNNTSGYFYSAAAQTFADVNFPGAFATYALGLNNTDTIVGYFAFTSSPNESHGFVDQSGQFTQLDIPNMPFTQATGVNDSGTVVGWYRNNQGLFHAYWFMNGTYTLYDVPGAQQTALFNIDNQGDMAGEWCSPGGRCHAFVRLANGAIRSFDFIGHPPINLADGVTNAGDIVGTYLARSQRGYRAGGFYGYRNGRIIHSLNFPGASETELLGMNSSRVIVGSYITQGVRHGLIAVPH